MNKEIQEKLFEEFTKFQLDIIRSKSKDYANEDVLSNFKTAGANAGISTEQQILSLIATKVARLGNLFKGSEPRYESIDDSIVDLANYTFLLHCVRAEQNEYLMGRLSEGFSEETRQEVKSIFQPEDFKVKTWRVDGPQENGY